MQLSFSAVLQCSCGDAHPIYEEANSDNDSEECFVIGSRPSPGETVECTLPKDNYQAVDELTQSSAVRETAGQEFEPEYAWGDHMFFRWGLCLLVCIKTNLLKALMFAARKNWSIGGMLGSFMGIFTRPPLVLF